MSNIRAVPVAVAGAATSAVAFTAKARNFLIRRRTIAGSRAAAINELFGRSASRAKQTAALALCLALVLAGGVISRAIADDYPQRTVTFVVPYPPGGGTDILTRMLAQELQDRLKQPFVVENRPGAGTLIAAGAVAKSSPDGHTLFLAPVTTLAMNPSVYKSLPYDPIKDFQSVGLVGSAQFVLLVNPSLGVSTMSELIALMKSKPPGEMSFASSGAGTPHHIFMEMFLKMAGLKAQHIPYRGSVAALTDVLSGQIPFMIVDIAPALALIKEGRVKALAVPSPTRVKVLPDVPTIAEAGLAGYAATGWFSVVARAGTPRSSVDKVNQILTAYLSQRGVQDRLQAVGIETRTSTPDELDRHIASELRKWSQVIREAGISHIE